MTNDPRDYRELESYACDYLIAARRRKHLTRKQKYQSALAHAMHTLTVAHVHGQSIDTPLFVVNCLHSRMRYHGLLD
jgi:hypothetical protein